MGGYGRVERTLGGLLNRTPRLKRAVETGYQRVNYHLRADSSFTHEVHEDASLAAAEAVYDVPEPGAPRCVGFYDICPWNDSGDAYLLHELPADDGSGPARILVVTRDRVRELARTSAWNHQQGSRLQWYSTASDAVIFNDIVDGRPVARVVGLDGTRRRTVDYPIQAQHPTAEEFVSVPYGRLDRNSPAYGYGTGSPTAGGDADDNGSHPGRSGDHDTDRDGLLRVTADGVDCLVTVEALADRTASETTADHYLHHVVYAPAGDRLAFLHRWQTGYRTETRLYVAEQTGALDLLADDPSLSHFAWLDDRRLFLWGRLDGGHRGYYVLDTETGDGTPVGALTGMGDGHPSVSPDGEWVVTDTYPDSLRKRHLTLYHRPADHVISLGSFLAPFGFEGARRCDLHPRWGPDGRRISIDSTHEGRRRSYILDVSDIVA